jgi:hypothetical protein
MGSWRAVVAARHCLKSKGKRLSIDKGDKRNNMSHNVCMSPDATAALIDRTRDARFRPGYVSTARRCKWCAAPALKAHPWCKRHQPGTARDRRPQKPCTRPHITAVARDTWTERVLPAELLAWPPMARIVAQVPRHTRVVPLADVSHAMAWAMMGDHEPWSRIVSRMRAAGLYQPGDPDLMEYVARGR